MSAEHAIDVEVRLYDRLFTVEDPTQDENKEGDEHHDFTYYINPDSLTVLPEVKAEPSLAGAQVGDRFQFMRKGYFAVDPDSEEGKLVFNRTVTLRDSWAKKKKK